MKNLSKEEVRTAEEIFEKYRLKWIKGEGNLRPLMLKAMEEYAQQQLFLFVNQDSQSEAVGWISVKDRLPEVGLDVWINAEYYQSKGTYLGSDQYGDKFREGMQFPRYNFVTHWQPLPSPPVSVGEEKKD